MNPDALDRYITGNYGEDQFKDMPNDKDDSHRYNCAYDAVDDYIRLWVDSTPEDIDERVAKVMEYLIDVSSYAKPDADYRGTCRRCGSNPGEYDPTCPQCDTKGL